MPQLTATVRRSEDPAIWNADWDWTSIVQRQFAEPYFIELTRQLATERASHTVYPSPNNVYRAFELTPLRQVRVVVLGQDPYHGSGQADGLSFSVPPGIAIPPSLRNIFRELQSDLGIARPTGGCLNGWAQRGVLLLNSILTVRAGAARSHHSLGWNRFTDFVLRQISAHVRFCVFLLWGNDAASKKSLIDKRHSIITSPHPSPLSAHRGFLGSRVFSRCNRALEAAGLEPLDWSIDE